MNRKALLKIFNRDLLVFIIVIVILSLTYGYQRSTFMAPQGLHQWRQSVGAAFAMNYYNYDLDITESRIYNNLSSKGTSDKTIAECPILYYMIGILYTIFGNNDSIFRIVNVLILFIGLFYLFKGSIYLLKDRFWALLVMVLIFTSPTLVYYGNSFLPDTASFGMVLIALYFILRYDKSGMMKYIYYASIIFALAGLLKISSLLSLLALIATFFLFIISSRSFREKHRIKHFVIPMLIPFAAVGIWYTIVHYYNTNYGGAISPVEVRPMWILDDETISKTWNRIKDEWVYSYFNVYFLIVAGLAFCTSLVLFMKSNKFLTILSTITLIGGVGFFILFFRSFYGHDYYMINIFILIVFVLVNTLLLFKTYHPQYFSNIFVKALSAAIVIFFVYQAVGIVDFKLNGYYNDQHRQRYAAYDGLEEVNRELGILPMDKVISMPDVSINISLYLMNQPGYTEFGHNGKQGTERIEFFISNGASYLFICDSNLYHNESYQYLQPYLSNKIGSHKNIDIYDIRKQ